MCSCHRIAAMTSSEVGVIRKRVKLTSNFDKQVQLGKSIVNEFKSKEYDGIEKSASKLQRCSCCLSSGLRALWLLL